MEIGVLLYRNRGFIGTPIRWQTRSPYSHASIDHFGLIYESRASSGVVARDWDERENTADTYAVPITHTQAVTMDEWLKRQLGKGYDFTMVMRFVTRTRESRRSSGRWFCSELVFAAFQAAGVDLLANTEPWEVSPGLLARSTLMRRVLITPEKS